MSDEAKNDERRAQEGPRAAEGRRDNRVVGARAQGDLVHGHRQVDGPAQEGEACRRDLLGLVRRGRRATARDRLRSSSTAGRARPRRTCTWARSARSGSTSRPTARFRRFPRSSSRTSRPGCRSPISSSSTRSGPVGAGSSSPRRRATARKGGGGGTKAGRRARSQGVLRLQARPRVDVRVHGTLALRTGPLGLARLHRGRELRRLSRRTPRADAPGDGGRRAERRDPHLARARDHAAQPHGLRRARLDRSRADDGGGGVPPRPLPRVPQGHVPGQGASATRRSSRPATTRRSSRAAPRCPRRSAHGSSRVSPTSSASRKSSWCAPRAASAS